MNIFFSKLRYSFGNLLTPGRLPTGCIVGSEGALYVQTESKGVFRGSTSDTGKTWIPIGGPSNVPDTRTLFAFGCSGKNIFAFDNAGTMFISHGEGDDNPISIQHIDFKSISSCVNSIRKATLTNLHCLPFIITNVAFLSNPGGVFSILPPTKIHDTLAPGATDTFLVKFDPHFTAG